MKIYLQFSTESGLPSWLIRYGTWSDDSHVDGKLPDGSLLGARLQGGFRIRPANYAVFTHREVYAAEVTEVQYRAIMDFAYAQIGKPYDKFAILNFLIHRKRDWRASDSWICSEAWAAAFEMGGYPLLNNLEPCDHVTPRDLKLSPLLTRVQVQDKAAAAWA